MSTQDIAAPAPSPSPVDVGQAEAALVEHYPDLVRLAYLVLPSGLGRNRRVLTAHALVQRSLPRRRTTPASGAMPGQRRAGEPAGGAVDAGYALIRVEVVRQALDAGVPLGWRAWPKRSQLPPLLPRVWGLRLFPRAGGAEELALDQRLSELSGAGRAAYALRGLERLGDAEAHRVLSAAGVADPAAAVAEADRVGAEAGQALLRSPEFDPCSLQARPTDLMRRRQHGRAALAALAAAVVAGTLLGLPGEGWGPDGAAAPPYARNAAVEAALDPVNLRKVAPSVWQRSARTDFSVWPARGGLTRDTALLRRALAVWTRPGGTVAASATPGTPPGPPMGPPQLLFAGEVDRARVVLFHDGLRVVRYAEPVDGAPAGGPEVALDFARADGADAVGASALVVGRTDANVRYLTAPWVSGVSARDLLGGVVGESRPVRRDAQGVTDPVPSPVAPSQCKVWDVLEVREGGGTRTLTDLGELLPARLTSGPPSAPVDVSDARSRAEWARTACLLPSVRAAGVRSVNSWRYAEQTLPGEVGRAAWLCTRAETWRGSGVKVLAQFQAPGTGTGVPAAKGDDSPACGARAPQVLAGVLWRVPGSGADAPWYLLAAGSQEVATVSASGGATGTGEGRRMALELDAKPTEPVELAGKLESGKDIVSLR
ncbi:hypothetical protein [Streptomyces lichenis]|uniref:DNA-directed RNA polymerase specialized sigma24 family protein n=1 Tax=Streptomyces lichenis TaxID=2306967 RepID=A0ABT0IEQ0_9ACTN|nr:hypothetical protein [Streptomyces lichenis]MCK8679765.1 hypothetical protein [Streptomyces lichenis]